MKVKFINNDTFLEVDSEFSKEAVDMFDDIENVRNFEEDTLEIPLESLESDSNE